jgi:lipoate-protein ligase A
MESEWRKVMQLFDLGEIEWRDSQLIYHAVAYLGIEGLVLHSTRQPYMCVGLHQDPREELDLDFCRENGIGHFRREVGGGVVLLDTEQVFYHLILRRGREGVPRSPQNFFKKYLHPVIDAYMHLGIQVEYRPLCDLVADGKKISGNGGGEVGECRVLAGGILLDFNRNLMSRCGESDPELRAEYLASMKENVTSVKDELGETPSKKAVGEALATTFQAFLGEMTPGTITTEIRAKMNELDAIYNSEKWLHQRGTRQHGREIKVREGVFILKYTFELDGNEASITLKTMNNRIASVEARGTTISLDSIIGLDYDRRNIINTIINILGLEEKAT